MVVEWRKVCCPSGQGHAPPTAVAAEIILLETPGVGAVAEVDESIVAIEGQQLSAPLYGTRYEGGIFAKAGIGVVGELLPHGTVIDE